MHEDEDQTGIGKDRAHVEVAMKAADESAMGIAQLLFVAGHDAPRDPAAPRIRRFSAMTSRGSSTWSNFLFVNTCFCRLPNISRRSFNWFRG